MPTKEIKTKKSGVIETLQSLVVAFVLAMVFRGFVVEGFVIPTGSMAPTLLGDHLQKHSNQTGQDFTVGFDVRRSVSADRFSDPLLGRNVPLSMAEAKQIDPRGGDRVLVLKTLYPFIQPKRFDVVVFKNPTDTQGPSANYIKRLIGLPGETIWIADGDVFASDDGEIFSVQRKPEHIQRSLGDRFRAMMQSQRTTWLSHVHGVDRLGHQNQLTIGRRRGGRGIAIPRYHRHWFGIIIEC